MIFLIEFIPKEQRTVTYRTFPDSESKAAWDARLALELDLHRKGKSEGHEIVLLQAVDEAAVRRTHQRYFGGIYDLIGMPHPSADSHGI